MCPSPCAIVVQSSDVLQYVWGKLAGRHLIAPKLSPSKTVEGFIGGVLSASLLGMALWWITPFAPWHAFGLALVAKIVGDHGGVIDCDSRPGRTRFRILLPVASGAFQAPIEEEVAK